MKLSWMFPIYTKRGIANAWFDFQELKKNPLRVPAGGGEARKGGGRWETLLVCLVLKDRKKDERLEVDRGLIQR